MRGLKRLAASYESRKQGRKQKTPQRAVRLSVLAQAYEVRRG